MLPSPFVSILPNTLSAFAMLVPPAPSAFSNSDLLIWPSPLASSLENRSFSASALLVGAGVVVAVDDWLCAASSALMVAGDSCEQPPGADAGAEPAEDAVLPDKSNGLLEPWLKPAACGVADFDLVSD